MDGAIPTYFPVCVIYSQLSLGELEELFGHYGDDGFEHGGLRIVRIRDENGHWRDTNRTIVLVSKKLFDNFMADGLYKPVKTPGRPIFDFRIVPYEVRKSNLPKVGFRKDLFVRLPKNQVMRASDVEAIIQNKISPLVKFGIITADQYSIKFPLRNKDRASGFVRGSCFIAFNESVSENQAALVKVVIDDTTWGNSEEIFRCYWARDQRPPKGYDNNHQETNGQEVRKIGLDKDGKKAFLKSEIVRYKEVLKNFPKKQQ